MRLAAALALVTAGGSVARAEAQARHVAPAAPSFAHVIFLNRCARGCTVTPGDDDARVDHSTIPARRSTIPPYPWGDASWQALVACVTQTYAPFAVTITDVDPGAAPHIEVMIGGRDADVQVSRALGIAPFIPCNGVFDDVIAFVFAAETSSVDQQCWAAAQESAHVLGLDHALDASDPMTDLDGPAPKRFQDRDAICGDDLPRPCACGGATQNSVRALRALFGDRPLR